jgi:hypothetical protein
VFDEFDVAYSVNSTSLFHALCSGLRCFQVDLGIPELPNEDFTRHSSIAGLSVDTLAIHETLLASHAERYIDNSFINITENPQLFNSTILLKLVQND